MERVLRKNLVIDCSHLSLLRPLLSQIVLATRRLLLYEDERNGTVYSYFIFLLNSTLS